MSITIAFGAIVMLLLFPSCGGKEKKLGEAITMLTNGWYTTARSLPIGLLKKGSIWNSSILCLMWMPV